MDQWGVLPACPIRHCRPSVCPPSAKCQAITHFGLPSLPLCPLSPRRSGRSHVQAGADQWADQWSNLFPFCFRPSGHVSSFSLSLSLSPSLFLARYIPHWECCSNKAGREGRPADGLASFQPPSLTFTALWMDGMAAVTEGRRELSLYAAGGWVSRHLAA